MFTLFYGPTSAYVHMIMNMTYSASDIGFPSFPLAFFDDFLHKTCHISELKIICILSQY